LSPNKCQDSSTALPTDPAWSSSNLILYYITYQSK
jgi:hypothetical protein